MIIKTKGGLEAQSALKQNWFESKMGLDQK
jgi:hypothetical protein